MLKTYSYCLRLTYLSTLSLMWVVANYYPYTSDRFEYCITKAMRTRSSFLAGCVRILRFMSVVSYRTISTRFLSRDNTPATLDRIHNVLQIPFHPLDLALVRQMLATNDSNLVAKSLTLPLVFQLLERPLRTIIQSLKADAMHPIIQRDTLLSLLLDAISQIAHSIMTTIEIYLQHSQSTRS